MDVSMSPLHEGHAVLADEAEDAHAVFDEGDIDEPQLKGRQTGADHADDEREQQQVSIGIQKEAEIVVIEQPSKTPVSQSDRLARIDGLFTFRAVAAAPRSDLRWVGETAPALERWLLEKPIPLFASCCLRGAGQVVFCNNPWTGLMITIGLFVQSPWVALMASLGLVTATASALVLRLHRGLYLAGIYGYNGILVGACLATFHAHWSPGLALLVILFAFFSTLLTAALGGFMVSVLDVSPLTLPFNLSTLLIFAGSHSFVRISFALTSTLPVVAQGPVVLNWLLALEAVIKGFGQVFLADNTITGLLIALGMAICSPIASCMALAGSLVGMLTGVVVGADPVSIYAGLWGYNAVLGAIAVGGFFYVPSFASAGLAMLCALFCALCGPAVSAVLAPVGAPAMTFPFCLVTLVFLLMRSATPILKPVSIVSLTVPEDHWRRMRASTQIASALRWWAQMNRGEALAEGGELCGESMIFAIRQKKFLKIIPNFKSHAKGTRARYTKAELWRVCQAQRRCRVENFHAWFAVLRREGKDADGLDNAWMILECQHRQQVCDRLLQFFRLASGENASLKREEAQAAMASSGLKGFAAGELDAIFQAEELLSFDHLLNILLGTE